MAADCGDFCVSPDALGAISMGQDMNTDVACHMGVWSLLLPMERGFRPVFERCTLSCCDIASPFYMSASVPFNTRSRHLVLHIHGLLLAQS
jgi:hypothetical protein